MKFPPPEILPHGDFNVSAKEKKTRHFSGYYLLIAELRTDFSGSINVEEK